MSTGHIVLLRYSNGYDIRFASFSGTSHQIIYRLIIFILPPPRRIPCDVRPDFIHVGLVPNDMFVIIPLPDGNAGGAAHGVDAFGDGGFERTHDGTNGMRFRPGSV